MKNPFSKSSIVDTVVNVGLGGAANVAMDYAVENVEALQKLDEQTVNIVKIAVGAIGGSMMSGKYAKYTRPAFDGIATVGAANLIKSYIADDSGNAGGSGSGSEGGTGGMPFIGRVKNRTFKKGVRGLGTVAFQGK